MPIQRRLESQCRNFLQMQHVFVLDRYGLRILAVAPQVQPVILLSACCAAARNPYIWKNSGAGRSMLWGGGGLLTQKCTGCFMLRKTSGGYGYQRMGCSGLKAYRQHIALRLHHTKPFERLTTRRAWCVLWMKTRSPDVKGRCLLGARCHSPEATDNIMNSDSFHSGSKPLAVR
jgi:hypothetical protein